MNHAVDQTHLEQGRQEGQRRFGALVLVRPVGMQAVAATAAGRIVERQAQVLPTQEPLESGRRLAVPALVVGHRICLEASRNGGGGFERLLVEARLLATLLVPAVGTDRHEMPTL